MLAELAVAKEWDEEMHRMQQQTIDRLIVAQQRIEAILLQNYELHKYPISRLFVFLSDSYERRDPRNFVMERFQLFFLCECGNHCRRNTTASTPSDQITIAAAAPNAPIAVQNSIHLVKHESYELSRPKEFFDRYDPYVLGMLRILKYCLAVAMVVTPAVILADSSAKVIMDRAIDMSINFLKQKLGEDAVAGEMTGCALNSEEEDMFNGFAALENADLRRLDSFLWKKDGDKTLSNLYMITTEAGHGKWVCLDYYREVNRETIMTPFLQCVETNGGTYDPQLGKFVVALNSSTAAKHFFSRLSAQAPAVTDLKVTLEWLFGSADLVMLID
ncbi:hypothetical protein BG015_005055 [Linnemannia schmuckeri]|uniref:Uncharacterized protein n=1 Tax=Linnemannia schmuckeri TaxID=64567 RepID=A0A9P5R7M9_9FUNG|nr:hypothetical protein BG015_005055 [Linnemannia schmuckeri]